MENWIKYIEWELQGYEHGNGKQDEEEEEEDFEIQSNESAEMKQQKN